MASGDSNVAFSKEDNEHIERVDNKIDEQPVKEENMEKIITPQAVEENETKLKERISQCKHIIESLKLELTKEKSKFEKEISSSQPSVPCYTPVRHEHDSSASSQIAMEDMYSYNMYSTSVDSKLNCDKSLIEYEKQLQKYQNTLNMAQAEKKNAIRKQMLAKAFKLKLLEVENQCNIELLRVKQSMQCLEPLQMIANKWKTSTNEDSYDLDNFELIPRFPELSANSGSDFNACCDDRDAKTPRGPELCTEENSPVEY